MSLTWNEATPPDLPPLRFPEKARGGARLTAAVTLTALLLAIFLIGRALRTRVPSVHFHFAVARFWSAAMLRLMGVRLETRGAPTPHGGAVLANHSSWADILALRAATSRLNFVSKAEVRDWGPVGWIAARCDTVFIERRRAAAPRQREELRDRLRAGELLCIFPEGTSSDGLRVLPFKSTLLSALFEPEVREAAWAQPATVNWSPPLDLPAPFYGWWGEMSFDAHIWQVLCRSRGGRAEVVFHAAKPVTDFPDRKALTRWAEEAVRAAKA